MQSPTIKLEKIHRQAEGNPIIHLSMLARTEGVIPKDSYGSNVMKVIRGEDDTSDIIQELLKNYNKETLVLCGFNNTRVKLNQYIRGLQEIMEPHPIVSDRVICLRNNHQKQIYNGMIGTIRYIEKEDDDWYYAKIAMDGLEEDKLFKGQIYAPQFNEPNSINFTNQRSKVLVGDIFDFGYALTVHKAQGSQSKRVVLFEERSSHMDDETWRRWLYTGITRAEEELFIIGR